MSRRSSSLKLSRRLLSNYLLFGLLSIVAVAVGMGLLANAVSQSAEEQSLLTRLTHVASEITRLLKDQQQEDVQQVVAGMDADPDVLFCAVLDAEGVIRAHTSAGFVGHTSPVIFSAAQAPGVVERISYLHEDGSGPREYWIPLRTDQKAYGMLQVAVAVQRPTTGLVRLLQQNAGMALAVPVLLLLVGGTRLRRVVGTSTVVGQQLSTLAEDFPKNLTMLRPVNETGPESTGWNRLVAHAASAERFSSLETRLSEVLGGFREERYEQILQALTDGVAVTGETDRITFANEAFARLLHRPLSDLMGEMLPEFLPQRGPDHADRMQRLLAESARPGILELWRTEDLADGILRLSRFPLRSRDGEIRSHLWSLRDVTQQKLVEYTRDQFVDTATHELRTPLSTIKACAEALELFDDIDLETQKHYVNTINNEATRLGRFVDEFLNISRMEAGSLALNRHRTQLERLLNEVVEKARPGFDLNQISFTAALPPKLPELMIDKDKIAAALMNLLGNAEKYTPSGGEVRLLVEVHDHEVRLRVEDTGLGIAPDELPRVFNKFFRSEDERVRQITGTGLGLSFSQEVVRLHGGNLTVSSELDHGSRFTMTLPTHQDRGHV
ncbi:MAG: ATP-binding protein [Fuerstiella sp.]